MPTNHLIKNCKDWELRSMSAEAGTSQVLASFKNKKEGNLKLSNKAQVLSLSCWPRSQQYSSVVNMALFSHNLSLKSLLKVKALNHKINSINELGLWLNQVRAEHKLKILAPGSKDLKLIVRQLRQGMTLSHNKKKMLDLQKI